MLAASGANFGFSSQPTAYSRGLSGLYIIGDCCWIWACSPVLPRFPDLYDIMKIISFIFLIYLAWRIGSAGRAQTQRPDEPLRFWQAAMFQLVNPKGVSVIISSVTAYTSSATTLASEVFVMFVVFSLVTIGSTFTDSIWSGNQAGS